MAEDERRGRQLLAERPHVCVFLDACAALSEDNVLTRSEYRVLLGLIAQVERGNYLYLSPAELARRCKIDYRVCLKAWKVLQTQGWLSEWYLGGYLMGYRLSPALCWYGRPWKAGAQGKRYEVEQRLAMLAASLEE